MRANGATTFQLDDPPGVGEVAPTSINGLSGEKPPEQQSGPHRPGLDQPEHSPEFFESIQKQAETLFNLIGQLNDDDDVNMFADIDDDNDCEDNDFDADTEGQNTSAEKNDGENDSSDDDEQDPFEKIQNSKVGKLAKELASEVSLEDFVDPSSMNGKNPKDAFKNFMGKDPKKLMGLVKKVSDKVKSKLASGEIKEPELIEEVQDMVSSLKNSKKFKKACKRSGMGDLFEKAMDPNAANPPDMEELMRSVMSNKRPQKHTTRDKLRQKISAREQAIAVAQMQTVKEQSVEAEMPSIEEIAASIDAVGNNNVTDKRTAVKKKKRKN